MSLSSAASVVISLFILAWASLGLAFQERGSKSAPVCIGMIDTLFEEKKEEKEIFAQMQPFADLVKKQTGVNGEFTVVHGPAAMGQQMQAGKLHLGVLHGVEYGWLKPQCPECRPLLIAVNASPVLKAHVLVARESTAREAADLKGQTVARPRRALYHTRLYLERLLNADPQQFFQVRDVDNTEAAIEAVIEKAAQLTVVDGNQMEVYRQRKPGRFARLKVLHESPGFPTAVVVYRPVAGREETVRQFREAMLKANQTREGRQTLTLWRLTGFREVPKDYEKIVDDIVKHYPPK
jgi:ABC-type phosphate/phosphonate transport system substrate-binding protein